MSWFEYERTQPSDVIFFTLYVRHEGWSRVKNHTGQDQLRSHGRSPENFTEYPVNGIGISVQNKANLRVC